MDLVRWMLLQCVLLFLVFRSNSQRVIPIGALPGDVEDGFSSSVSTSGDTIVVGAPFEESSAPGVNGDQNNDDAITSGAAYVYVRNGTTWMQQAYLKASNTEGGDYFGWSVSISGDTIVVGAYYENSSATGVNGTQGNGASHSGAAYVFVRERNYLDPTSISQSQ